MNAISAPDAGRFDERYAPACWWNTGIRCDCSVTPRVNWKTARGAAGRWRDRLSPLSAACLFRLEQMTSAARVTLPLLEVPMSIQYKHSAWMEQRETRATTACAAKCVPLPYTGCDRWAAMWDDDEKVVETNVDAGQ